MIAVTGHYISYTFFAVIIRDVVGVRGPDIAWLLATYGIAGLLAMPLVARPMDHRPWAATISCMVGLYVTFAGADCAGLPPAARGGDRPDRGHCDRVVGCHRQRGVADAAIRGDARRRRRSRTARPGLYMAAFQVGIMAGSFAGGLFYEHGVLMMLAASAALIGIGAAGMTVERQLFDVPTADRP